MTSPQRRPAMTANRSFSPAPRPNRNRSYSQEDPLNRLTCRSLIVATCARPSYLFLLCASHSLNWKIVTRCPRQNYDMLVLPPALSLLKVAYSTKSHTYMETDVFVWPCRPATKQPLSVLTILTCSEVTFQCPKHTAEFGRNSIFQKCL